MKIINNQSGYTTSILILILLLPLIMLMIIIIDEYSHDIDNNKQTIESEKIKSKTEDYENQIITITKIELHNTTLNVINSKKPLMNSQNYLKEEIQKKLLNIQEKYKKDNININTEIMSIKSSNNPFEIEIKYHITSTMNNSNIKIEKEEKKLVRIDDKKYPVYDPLPTLKTGATFQNNQIHYNTNLAEYIKLENNIAYANVITPIIIKECPYNDYNQHGNNNQSIINCIHNHYYHYSHDGMCLLCRLENKTSCSHYGFETFILPTMEYDEAPTSIDHVLLNDQNNQYAGNKIKLDNKTIIYLDDGHKTKYNL